MKHFLWIFLACTRILFAGTPNANVAIYYQEPESKFLMEKIAARIKAEGIPVTLEHNALRQIPAWANSIRFFHFDDIDIATRMQALANEVGLIDHGGLKLLDLSKEFSGHKIKPGRIEFWICDDLKNSKLPPAPYEAKFKPTPAPTPDPPRGYFDFSKENFLDSQTGKTLNIVIRRDRRLEARKKENGPQVNEGGIDRGNDPNEYLNAIVVLEDDRGNELDSREMEEPIATLKPSSLAGEGPIFLLTVDYSIGMGSYNGPITFLLAISGIRLKILEFVNSESKKQQQFRMMDSLKNAWKILDSKTILEVSCHPDFDNPKNSRDNLEFAVDYYRFSFQEGNWVEYLKTVSGFWENEGDFPNRKFFP
jgi:hypothetical protein